METEGVERVLMLVKAMPHVGRERGELVCCAGVTEQREWRRQYPVRFRFLTDESMFQRWHWVEYHWRLPKGDRRPESRRVDEGSIVKGHEMKSAHRGSFLARLILPGVKSAEERGQTLTLVRPKTDNIRFSWKKDSSGDRNGNPAIRQCRSA
ncbi:MAG: hypothetical protein HQL56_16875 [Magnetococcales bacterium]|nr:hypothetical protein [Magnetococcales bacterium]